MGASLCGEDPCRTAPFDAPLLSLPDVGARCELMAVLEGRALEELASFEARLFPSVEEFAVRRAQEGEARAIGAQSLERTRFGVLAWSVRHSRVTCCILGLTALQKWGCFALRRKPTNTGSRRKTKNINNNNKKKKKKGDV